MRNSQTSPGIGDVDGGWFDLLVVVVILGCFASSSVVACDSRCRSELAALRADLSPQVVQVKDSDSKLDDVVMEIVLILRMRYQEFCYC